MIRELFEKRIYVKPVGENWGVFQFSILESFWDDLWCYGPDVALGNLVVEWALLIK